MSRKAALCVIVLAVALSLSACAAAPNQVQLTDRDADRSVEIAKGGTLEITLEGNLTTGYNWSVVSGNDALLRQAGEAQFKADTQLLGSPGKLTLRFHAIETGTVPLKLGYLRSWEKDVPPIKTFQVTIIVK